MGQSTASREDIRIGGEAVAPGTTLERRVRAVEEADGAWVEIPVVVTCGSRPGPVLFVGGGVHGDETNSVAIVARLVHETDAKELAGTLIAIPVQSPVAFRTQHRLPLAHYMKSPMDQSPIDVFHSFPGDPNGNMAAVIAHVLFDGFMSKADLVLDIHTPTTGGRYAPFVFLPPTRCGAVVDRCEELGKVFGADFILANDKGMYVGDKNPHVVAAERGIPAFGIELGEGGRLEDEEIDRGIRGLRNIMRAIGMLPGETEVFGRREVIRTMTVIRSTRAGLLRVVVGLREEVRKGQVVATITDIFGRVTEEIVAPHAGPVVRVTTFSTVGSGERVVQLGVKRDSQLREHRA
jgi:predicted deacylase